jgi:hypothetical protein
MIVTRVRGGARTVRGDRMRLVSRVLARRGFFHSETESFDHVELAPGAEIGTRGRDGTEEIWLVVAGAGRLVRPDGSELPLRRDSLAVCGLDSGTVLRAGPQGMAAVLVSVVPDGLTRSLPVRLPAA